MAQRILSSYPFRFIFMIGITAAAVLLGGVAQLRHRVWFKSSAARFGVIAFGISMIFSLVSRCALTAASFHELSKGEELILAFLRGFCFDACVGAFASLPWILLAAMSPGRVTASRAGRMIVNALMFSYITILLFITVSEYVFWDEFGARFNFIAVDYLVWTQEVWGNLSESYPLAAIFSGMALASMAATWWLHRRQYLEWAARGSHRTGERLAWPASALAIALIGAFSLGHSSWRDLPNQYNSEISKNGCWSFIAAFRQMELDYQRWYISLPGGEALLRARKLLASPGMPMGSAETTDLHRIPSGKKKEQRWNVMLICMESMSWDFMEQAGLFHDITPHLDHLARESVSFENLYATGTRTVRGMEALTLCLPPTPGQSILYRPEGSDLVTTFAPFLKRGYDCGFFYGGDGRFDYMNRYFSTAGCRIVDQPAWKPEDTTFKTSWGACDDDLFHKAIREADADHAAGRPFHFFCMTTSNHRPYDFPEGRIDLPSHTGRIAAVKYADQAIGDLIAEARKHPWFDETVFVICADHCASSAGKTEIDVTKYRIPAMVYCPAHIAPAALPALSSQIDVMPTVFGLLGWNDATLGFGRNLLEEPASPQAGRAFVSNYQKIGLLRPDALAILKPNRIATARKCNLKTGDLIPLEGAAAEQLIMDAATYYQAASWLFTTGRLKRHETQNTHLPESAMAGSY